MKNKFLFSIGVSTLLAISTLHAVGESVLFGQQQELNILVNNRVLAKVNGKAISVMDVMKKMDMIFLRQFPEYTSSPQARFQFYQVNWKHVLADLVDKELILAEAEEKKVPITGGDVRQEMEHLFGPNIIESLDKIGLIYEEAAKIVRGDILIRRMLFFRVNNKAMKQVTPQTIRNAYDEYAKDNVRPEEWIYYVISIRDKDAKRGEEAANMIHQHLTESALPLSELSAEIKEKNVNVSSEYRHNEKEMSAAYKDIVTKLSPGEYSLPIAQKSRSDKSMVYRIFYLKEKSNGGVPPFAEVESKLQEKLIEIAIEKETEAYLAKLRQHFDVQESHLVELNDEEFQPFVLR